MRTLLSLPPSLLLLLATQLHAAQADPRDQNQNRNQDDETQTLLPTAVRKMSLDEGEKFMPEYYAFAPPDFYAAGPQTVLGLEARDVGAALTPEEEALLATNSSAILLFRPPFPRHLDYRGLEARSRIRGSMKDSTSHDHQQRRSEEDSSSPWSLYRRAVEALARLQGRDFNCPGGTHVCSNIDQPNYCCPDGTTCFVVENSPDAGNVGCCPDGQTCGGSVAACSDGNTACPAEEGGGCCIPGFVCADVGCVQSTSATTSTTTTSTPPPTTSTSTSTSTSTPTPSSQPTTSTPPTTATTTSASATNSATGTGLPPVRPTSSTPTTAAGSPTSSYCPTGFYACVASAGSGCCRTGRDCSTTSCPAVASTTIVTGGATVVVPLTDAQQAATLTATATATCASGWFLCGADAGPVSGCCPSGYMCGTASCTLSAATATATVQKALPGNAAAGGWAGRRGEGVMLLGSVALGWFVFLHHVI
ncbi:hypothetical protein F5Y12DRAFT_516215 [Xylaria sp. FL1777]|nr:hypothetical protein F5Y12DRAFT_516215 [Xylaria sp. FL1777]